MFIRIHPVNNPVMFSFEDQQITADSGDTVAAALLGSGISGFRESAETKQSRGPFCMIGNCFECLVKVDGVPNLQACRITVREGMRVRKQCGLTELEINSES